MLELIVISTLNGVLFGMLLFLMASGLTVIFSMLGVLNFAHASFYMLGAFFGFQISRWFGFWPALLIAPLLAGMIGAGVERYGLRRVHRNGHVAELLFTFGLAFVIEEVVQIVWGRSPVDYRVPALLDFPAFTIFSTNYPAYKMFMLLVSIAIFIGLLLVLKKTRIGLIVQAALTHPHMVGHLGHNVGRVFMLVFGVGTALAAVAGVIAGPALVTQSNIDALALANGLVRLAQLLDVELELLFDLLQVLLGRRVRAEHVVRSEPVLALVLSLGVRVAATDAPPCGAGRPRPRRAWRDRECCSRRARSSG